MVATVDGSVTDVVGRSGGISGDVDRRVFRVLRDLADAVVVGARTAEVEGYRRAAVPVVLLTRSLALDLTSPLLSSPGEEGSAGVLVIAPAAAPVPRRKALLEQAARSAGSSWSPPVRPTSTSPTPSRSCATVACCTCSARVARRSSPASWTRRLVDELCVTTSPYVVGGPRRPDRPWRDVPEPRPWHLDGLCEEDGFLFARWQRPAPPR